MSHVSSKGPEGQLFGLFSSRNLGPIQDRERFRILADLFGRALSGGTPSDHSPTGLQEDLSTWLSMTSAGGEVDWGEAFSTWERSVIQAAKQNGELFCRKARWPRAAPFAAFLSHDVDQVHDREIFRWLGDVNHLRRHLFAGERGDRKACLRRILRPLIRPADPYDQFASIRRIEGKHGWKSTFFLLEDKYWARMGGRFKWTDREFRRISRYLLDEGCELGIHGSAYSHDAPQWWQGICARFSSVYGESAVGARNHYLKLQVPQTWESQRRAGLLYDSTLGFPDRLGAPGGFCFPFRVPSAREDEPHPLIEIPLSVMDQTLFRYLNLDGEGAFDEARGQLSTIIAVGGLAVLLWHNNFFHEEEYREWEQTYERLLDWLAPQKPWVACGRDIATWWEARCSARLTSVGSGAAEKAWQLTCGRPVDHLAVEIFGIRAGDEVEGNVRFVEVRKEAGGTVLLFPHLDAGATACFHVRRMAAETSRTPQVTIKTGEKS
jgi:hypothetical protein